MKLILPTYLSLTAQVSLVMSTSLKSDFLLNTLQKRSTTSNKNLSNLRNYGCYCFKSDQYFFSGKGPGLNKLDKACKALNNCYKCNAHTLGSCDPVNYQKVVRMTPEGRYQCPHEDSDLIDDQCDVGFCQCDQKFLNDVENIDFDSIEKSYLEENLDSTKCVMSHPTNKVQAAQVVVSTAHNSVGRAGSLGRPSFRPMPQAVEEDKLSVNEVKESIMTGASHHGRPMPPMASNIRLPNYTTGTEIADQPSFKFGVGAPSSHSMIAGLTRDISDSEDLTGSNSQGLMEKPQAAIGMGGPMGRPMASANGFMNNINFNNVKNNLADVVDTDIDSDEQDLSDYLYEDSDSNDSQNDSEHHIATERFGVSKQPTIIVPADNVSECCGDGPSWFPIHHGEHKSCCNEKSYNVLLSNCCDGVVKATGAC